MNERDDAFGKYNLAKIDLAKLFVKFSSHKTSLNNLIGGYIIDTDYAKMDLIEAEILVESMKNLQAKIKKIQTEIDFYKEKFGFEE